MYYIYGSAERPMYDQIPHEGFVAFKAEETTTPASVLCRGEIQYDRPLTQEEMAHYRLTFISNTPIVPS